jgi:pimeloyl-ACP methyl ester carboxylesterase
MVLVHGLGGSKLNWMLAAPLLAERYRVLALDLAGFGETPLGKRRADVDSNQRLLDGFVRTVAGEPTIVVGHSMGGLITMLQAARRPEVVRAAVLVDPAFPPTTSPAPGIPKPVLRTLALNPPSGGRIAWTMTRARGAEAVVREALDNTCASSSRLDPAFVAAHIDLERARMEDRRAYVGYLQAWRSMDRIFADTAPFERDVVQAMLVPTLLLHGALDPLVLPAAAHRLAALRPDWTARFIDGIGHNPQFEAPQEFTALVIAWLDGALARVWQTVAT